MHSVLMALEALQLIVMLTMSWPNHTLFVSYPKFLVLIEVHCAISGCSLIVFHLSWARY